MPTVVQVLALALAGLLAAAPVVAQTPPAGGRTTILAFGDSITIGFREPGVDCARPDATAGGYPEHLEDELLAQGRQIQVVPRGLCGEHTAEGVSRIDEVLAEPAFQNLSGVVILMEGTNDLSRGNPPIGVESVAANLQLMAGKAATAGWTPVYSSIIPYGPPADVQNRNERAEKLADRLAEIAISEARPFADPFHDLLAVPEIFEDFYHSDGFHLTAEGNEILAQSFVEPTLSALRDTCDVSEPCVEDGPTLCLQNGRFQVDVEWKTADAEGVGHGEPLTSDTGRFWFFGPQNLELLLKILDARCYNEHFWVFYGALSDQQFVITVTDKTTCARRVYFNPPGQLASVGDTAAFPVAPDNPDACP